MAADRTLTLLQGYSSFEGGNIRCLLHVGDLSLSTVEDKGDKAIYEQDTAWLRECDIVVAECTQVSVGGYELAYAEAHGKKICLIMLMIINKIKQKSTNSTNEQ